MSNEDLDAALAALIDKAIAQAHGRVADLVQRVCARLGSWKVGAGCTIFYDVVCGRVCVQWRRVYADGSVSDERGAKADTIEECLRAVLAWEDAADKQEPQHAGPPPEAA